MKKLALALSLVAVLGLPGIAFAGETAPIQDDQQITEHHWGRGYSRGERRGGRGHGGGWRHDGYYQHGNGYYSDGTCYGGDYY